MSTYDWSIDLSKNEELCKSNKVGRDFLKSTQYYSSGSYDIKSMLAKTVAIAVLVYGVEELSKAYEKSILDAIESSRNIDGFDFNFVVRFFKAYIGDLSDVLVKDMPKVVREKNRNTFAVVQNGVSKLPMLFVTVGSAETGLYDWNYTMGILSGRLLKGKDTCACMYNRNNLYTIAIVNKGDLTTNIEDQNLNGYLNGYYRKQGSSSLFTDLVPVQNGCIAIKDYNRLSDNALSVIDSILFTDFYSPVVVLRYVTDRIGTEYLKFSEGICKFAQSNRIVSISKPIVLRKVICDGKEEGIVVPLENSTEDLKMVIAKTSLNVILDIYDKKWLKWGSNLYVDSDLESLTDSSKEYMLVKEEDLARTILKVDNWCAGVSSTNKKQLFITKYAISNYNKSLFKKWYFIMGNEGDTCRVVISDSITCYIKSEKVLKSLIGTLEVLNSVGIDKFKNNAQFSALLGLPKWNLKFMLDGKLFDYKTKKYREAINGSKPRYSVVTNKDQDSMYKYILQEAEV